MSKEKLYEMSSRAAAASVPRIRGLSPFAGGCVYQEGLKLRGDGVEQVARTKPRGAVFGGVKHDGLGRLGRRDAFQEMLGK